MEQTQLQDKLQAFGEIERIFNIPAIILALLSLCQNFLLLFTLKIKTSAINMFHLSLGTSSIIFSLVIILPLYIWIVGHSQGRKIHQQSAHQSI
jgi:hypothetical protein